MERLVSALGVLVMMGLAYAMCPKDKRKHVAWKSIGFGVLVLVGFAFIVLKTPARVVFSWGNDVVERLLAFTKAGAEFVFGGLAGNPASNGVGFIFAFQVLPTIIFFAALMGILYHVGFMPFVIRHMARFIAKVLKTSGAESFSTVADIFVGQTEAPLVIRPYISSLTMSELNACMVAGFATTAGGVLAAYVAMLNQHIPGIAGHLIACSVMCAPASIVIAKLMLPETGEPRTMGNTQIDVPRSNSNLLEAITVGTTDGLTLAINVAAMLISFTAIMALVNFLLGWVGTNLLGTALSLEHITGVLFAPIAFFIGVPAEDIFKVGGLLGTKTVLNEFVAYSSLTQELAKDPAWLTERSRLLASYALCGFANFASIGIQIGGYSGLAPERRGDLSTLGFKAMLGGFLTTCLVACVAGILL